MKKIIHRFWGGSETPEEYKRFGEMWSHLNPDWDVIMWKPYGESLIPVLEHSVSGVEYDDMPIVNINVWRSINTPPAGMRVDTKAMWTQRADVIGYELVHKFGGLYVNTDIEPLRPLEKLFDSYPGLSERAGAAMEDDNWIVNAVLWAPEPGNQFFANVINLLPNRYFAMPSEYMNVTTGPHLITSVFNLCPGMLMPIDKKAFSWIHWSEVEPGGSAIIPALIPEDVIGIHHWGHRKSQRPQTSWVV